MSWDEMFKTCYGTEFMVGRDPGSSQLRGVLSGDVMRKLEKFQADLSAGKADQAEVDRQVLEQFKRSTRYLVENLTQSFKLGNGGPGNVPVTFERRDGTVWEPIQHGYALIVRKK